MTFLLSLTTGDRDEAGNFVLRNALTTKQRDDMRARAADLARWFQPTPKNRTMYHLIAMFMQMGGASMTRDDAKELAETYATSLTDIPEWSLERTCGRFARGEVRPEEFGAKTMDVNFRPSSAAIRRVCVDLVRPFGEESTRIHMTLRGTIGYLEDPAQRARVEAEMDKLLDHLREKSEPGPFIASDGLEDYWHAEAKLKATADARRIEHTADARDRAVMAEYEAHGLPPKFYGARPQSLSMLKSMGWTIEDGPYGGKILVRPRVPAEKKQTNETMGDSR